MKNTNITITMLCLAAACACGDTKITWLADVTADRAETVTGVQSNQIAAAAAHIPRTDNPHGVTAAQIGALTTEQDLAALRTYHYGSPDIVESPAEWFVFDGAGTITAFNWAGGRENVVIPWAIGGVPVTAIGANAFRNLVTYQGHPVVSVVAPQTVTAIGDYAFYYCYTLTSVSLPQATSIGDYAFTYCTSLTSASLPQATSIGDYAFADCNTLTSVNLPQATAIGDYAFYYCYTLTSVSLPQATSIGDYAFTYCTSLTSASLPQATSIGDYAFADCNTLTSVTIPQATSIGDYAFAYCYTLTSVSLPQATAIGDYAFYYCTSLTSASLPQATSIGDYAFTYCTSLTSVHMGQNAPAEATDVFEYITPPPTVYVTNPQATGWGATWNGAPVVRPPLYGSNVTAQAFTLGGDTITEWPAGGGSVPYADWTGTVTPQNGTASVAYAHGNMPVLVVPDGGGTTYVTIATGTYAATSGVSRVSLSIWAGTNTIELITNEVDYATAPDIPTDSWGTILFRRVSDGRWKGVGL